MKRMVEVTLDEAAMADLGIPVDDLDFTVDDLPPDPLADQYDAMYDALYDTVPVDGGSMRAAIERVVANRQRMAECQAEEYRALARLSVLAREGAELVIVPEHGDHDAKEVAYRTMVAEVAMVSRVSARSMAARVAESELIATGFPHTLEELAVGSINAGHVRVIVEHGLPIADAAVRAVYESIVLNQAVTTTPGRLRRVAELTAAKLGTEAFQERHERAAAERQVRVGKLPDGMSELILVLPTLLAAGVWDRLTAQARTLSRAGDPRSFDQLRADLATDLLLTGDLDSADGSPHALARGITAEVAIVIPALTLLGHSKEPATLAGQGPIGLAEAKLLAAKAPSMVRILTHPATDLVLSVDTYRPSEKLRRFLRIRDGRCRFPGCTRPPNRCDIDHTIAAETGGPTTVGNLAHLCRGDHTLKHHGGWSVKQLEPGVLEWTSPNGYVHTDTPDPTVHFAA
ncbi:HNH endonuclease signature motif containing protein [Homoserinimonas sp. A520]